MAEKRKIPAAVMRRLPRYYRYLTKLMEKDIWRISSKELAERMGVTSSQVRQDLNFFGSFGQQGYGYNVESLRKEIEYILGMDKQYTMVLVGAGGIGSALTHNKSLAESGFDFVATFDDEAGLEQYLSTNSVDIVVVDLPDTEIAPIIKILAKSDIGGVWNFSAEEMQLPKTIKIENFPLMDSLAMLTYKLNEETLADEAGTPHVW
ncbi:MAG: redox-sensing transcriptional repressor Rex [Defluviitaleaceae bacterium]|nr:redox-sensing transcriptional repressor Rex [Defluviitaleaceae bacterium]